MPKLAGQFSRHLELIYDAVGSDLGWESVLAAIANDVHAQSAIVSIDNVAEQRLLVWRTHGFSEASMRSYGDYYSTTDLWAKSLSTKRSGQFYATHALAGDAEFLNSEFCHDWAKPIGMRHSAGAYIEEADGLAIRVAFQRNAQQGFYTQETVDYLNSLLPHIKRAAELGRELGRLRVNDLLSETGAPGTTAMLVSDTLQILAMNKAAMSRMDSGKEPSSDLFGRLKFASDDIQEKVAREVRAWTRPPGNDAQPGRKAFEVRFAAGARLRVLPFPSHLVDGFALRSQRMALIVIEEIEHDPVKQRVASWNLTRSESEVLTLLMSGLSANEISVARSRQLETVRSQVKSILRKSGFSRIASLIASFSKRSRRS